MIDCGANYGDVWFALGALGKKPRYIAIEPDPSVLGTLKKNLPNDASVYEIALGDRDQDFVEFFVSGMSGDSSIFQPEIVKNRVLVPMQTLETFVADFGLAKICLLKLEAGGQEVEILQGAQKVLERFSYVAIDGSAERGGHETFKDLKAILENSGFVLIYRSDRYVSALFACLH